MKKLFLISLICIYSLATMGFSLKQFYCCGKLSSISISLTQETKKTPGNGIHERSCCESKYQVFKVKDDHFSGGEINAPSKHFTDLQLFIPSFTGTYFTLQKTTTGYKGNAPPTRPGVPLYLYNCVFRI